MIFLLASLAVPCLWYLSKNTLPRLSKLCGAISVTGIAYTICILILE